MRARRWSRQEKVQRGFPRGQFFEDVFPGRHQLGPLLDRLVRREADVYGDAAGNAVNLAAKLHLQPRVMSEPEYCAP